MKQSNCRKDQILSMVGRYFVVLIAIFMFQANQASAQLPTVDVSAKVDRSLNSLLSKLGTTVLNSVVRNALNKIAYDAANYIASGGEGQSAQFIVKDPVKYVEGLADSAAGEFIDSLNKWGNFNLCEPNLDVKLKIGLGLTQYQEPAAPACTFSKMYENWETDINAKFKDITSGDYLDKVADIFNPTSNEVSIAYSLVTGLEGKKSKTAEDTKDSLNISGLYTDKRDVAGNLTGTPGQAEKALDSAQQAKTQALADPKGDSVLKQAAEVFLNQLALATFNNALQKLGKTTSSLSGSTGSSALTQSEADVKTGEVVVKEKTASIITPRFDTRTDYEILSDLASCPDSKNPGPNNCVISSQFSQAISEHKIVADAVTQGYISQDAILGDDNGPLSYRNLVIMRKFRIIPAGWEIAAQRNLQIDKDKRGTLMDFVSCFESTDQYQDFNPKFDHSNCSGLVDPNWVLKAPLNYCAKEGSGGYIMNSSISQVDDGYGGMKTQIDITRSDDYCADEQTCVKENSDGTCAVYGYCNEEKNTWDFSGESCDPINNTCRSFVADGKPVSYLENTIDYSVCNANNAGCSQYARNGSYNKDSGAVAWNLSNSIFLSNQVESCSDKEEGCSQYVRVRPGTGNNLVVNSDFGDDAIGDFSTGEMLNDWPVWSNGDKDVRIIDGQEVSSDLSGVKILSMSASRAVADANTLSVAVYSNQNSSLLPSGFSTVSGYSYTLSADVYLAVGDKIKMYVGSDKTSSAETIEKNTWIRISATRAGANPFADSSFQILGYSAGSQVKVYVKNVKFEMNDWATGYSKYLANPTYEKVIPSYLESICYKDPSGQDYSLKPDAPAICSTFARRCSASEVGCELFKSAIGGITLTARAGSSDYCNVQCVGYDRYVSKAGYFSFPEAENIIPAAAKACTADAVGCSEFTNLDDLASGGEKKEYYSQLKQCIKPDESACADFYLWEGGTELNVLSLKKDSQGGPAVVADDSSACNEEIFNLPPSSPAYNGDCREFHNKAGQVFYHLQSKTITCSNDCKRYRLSDHNFDSSIISSSQCQDNDRFWDETNSVCYVCKNGGIWDNSYKACIYQAIPSEGKSCAAASTGCREYNGKDGNSQKIAVSYDFEGGVSPWQGVCNMNSALSSQSSAKGGQSLYVSSGSNSYCPGDNRDKRIQADLGNIVTSGKSYIISFLAKAEKEVAAKIYLANSNNEKAVFNTDSLNSNGVFTIAGGNQWQLYKFSLDAVNHDVASEIIALAADGDYYIDNIVINEVSDRYYLVRNSSNIPQSCYYDNYDNYRGADYNLGCRQYIDRAGVTHNLKSFSKICEAGSVGCEMMIDTFNSSSHSSTIMNDTNANGSCDGGESDCLYIPEDSVKYVIYDSSKRCNAADKGCSRLGKNVLASSNAVFLDQYQKIDYDKAGSIMCSSSAVGCKEYKYKDGSGSSYFKDPLGNVCEYRIGKESNTIKSWYKQKQSRCDLNSDGSINPNLETKICLKNADCGGNISCVQDVNDYPCAVSFYKTIGDGGQIPVPSGSVGACEAAQSSCTEYVDPISKFNDNLINWNGDSEEIYLDKYRLYSLKASKSGRAMDATVEISFPHSVSRLYTSNNFEVRLEGEDAPETLTIDSATTRLIFNSLDQKNEKVRITCKSNCSGLSLELKQLSVNYQLKSSVDKSSCNGTIDEARGCILFDERSQNGSKGISSLYWTASSTSSGTPALCNSSDPENGSNCFANSIIKVEPNRVCSRWLSCKTYSIDEKTKEKVCYDLAECQRMDDAGNCVSIVSGLENDNIPSNVYRSTGYSYIYTSPETGSSTKISLSTMKEVGLNTSAHYDFEESIPALSCVRSSISGSGSGACSFDKNIVADSIIDNPDDTFATDYPAHGDKYLKVLSYYKIASLGDKEKISVLPNQDYYINYLVNTKESGGLRGKVIISYYTSASATTPSSVESLGSDSAANGWERKVHHFKTGSGINNIRIEFTSDADKASPNYVYFDDINIEPVLDMGDGTFQAKDCRLYPQNTSVVCESRNANVIEDGVEGYCLFRDPKNTDVCLMWYPVDKISSSLLDSRQVLGFRGVAPLYYCSDVNANFEFMEKRAGKMLAYSGGKTDNLKELIGRVRDDNKKDSYSTVDCGSVLESNNNDSDNPNKCTCLAEEDSKQICGSYDYNAVFSYSGNAHKHVVVLCVPDRDKLSLLGEIKPLSFSQYEEGANCSVSYREGWGVYNGLLNYGIKYAEANSERGDVSKLEPINESANVDSDPVRIWDKSASLASERNLMFIDNSDHNSVYRLSCNRFVEAVDSFGNNRAWTGRVSSLSDPYETPSFFGSYSTMMYKYGRNRDVIPYGAASIPDDYDLMNSGLVYFRNQYSKKDGEIVLAGRPYGCNSSSSKCQYVGYCSLDPNVYCLLDPIKQSGTATGTNIAGNIDQLSCSDGRYGTCLPLWDNSNISAINPDTTSAGTSILKNIFLKYYGDFRWDKDQGIYRQLSTYYDYLPTTNVSSRTDSGAFTNVYPVISNVSFNNVDINSTSKSFSTEIGINVLKFNSTVDIEQQPLREIYIDWGDGVIQTIVGQDHRPGSDSPHVLYHYYDKVISNPVVKIEIVDNWGLYSYYRGKIRGTID